MRMPLEPITLKGRYVRLEPLTLAHVPRLSEVALDAELWQWTLSQIRTEAELREYVESALHEQEEGSALPFATIESSSGRPIGSTRFGSIDLGNRRVEIGWTWIGRAWQRTPINTEAKLLMLRHAFEVLGCIRVELKTDALNARSRAAIARIGAREEGTLRQHMITSSGRLRDSVLYSLIDKEWPEAKARLEEKLARPYAPR